MNGQTGKNSFKLGDLIAALFEEARVLTSDRGEQTVLVYAALKDLLRGKVRPAHPIALKVGARMTDWTLNIITGLHGRVAVTQKQRGRSLTV